MELKYLFVSLIVLMLACSVAAIAAEEDYGSLGDYTFDIPDGYQVVDDTDDMFTMEADENHTVVVYKLDTATDFDLFKSLLEDQGCEFGEEDSFQSGSFNVTQYSYNYLNSQGYLYVCEDGSGASILSAYAASEDDDAITADDNPARQVVDSLE